MKYTINIMENYKIKLVYWLANQFGYEITMVKNFLVTKLRKKLNKKKKVMVQVDEVPVLTLRDKLKEMGKL